MERKLELKFRQILRIRDTILERIPKPILRLNMKRKSQFMRQDKESKTNRNLINQKAESYF